MEDEIALYCFSYKINDNLYGGHIPAISWEDAQEKVSTFNGTVDGKLVETRCANCGNMDNDGTAELSPYDFPEVIGD